MSGSNEKKNQKLFTTLVEKINILQDADSVKCHDPLFFFNIVFFVKNLFFIHLFSIISIGF